MENIKLKGTEVKHLYIEERSDKYEVDEIGEWEDEGKYQSSFMRFRDIDSGQMYWVGISRYGDYYQGYELDDYGNFECVPVFKVIRTITKEVWTNKIEEGDKEL